MSCFALTASICHQCKTISFKTDDHQDHMKIITLHKYTQHSSFQSDINNYNGLHNKKPTLYYVITYN